MGWGFRKSVSAGGFRFTFSKSGVSTSWGANGFRVTRGPRGVFVSSRAGGFYYRQRVGGSRLRTRPTTTQFGSAVTAVDSADVRLLSDISQDEFVKSLNEWTTRGWWTVIAVTLCIVVLTIHTQLTRPWLSFFELFAYCVIAVLLVRALESERRKFLLVFDLDAQAQRNFDELTESLRSLSTAGVVRGVKLRNHLVDWKRNGGATGAMTFESVTVRRAAAPHVESNVTPWCVTTQNKSLWFFPDRILIRQNGRFAALSYDALTIEHGTGSFVWSESLPRDAQVIGQTWQFVRKDGGPDRRFSNNRQIPIVCAAYLSLESQTGLNIIVQTTSLPGAHAVAARLGALSRPLVWATSTEPSLSADVVSALLALGLDSLPTQELLRETYVELAKRNHPDRFANAAPAIVAMAEERMREINSAYASLARGTSAGPPPPQLTDGLTNQHAREVGIAWKFSTTLALLSCAAVFIAAHAPGTSGGELEARAPAPVVTTPVPTATASADTKVLARACTLRAAEGAHSPQILFLQAGTPVVVLSTAHSGWKHVRLQTEHEGWVGPKCWAALLKDGSACRADDDCNSGHCDGNDAPGAGRCAKP